MRDSLGVSRKYPAEPPRGLSRAPLDLALPEGWRAYGEIFREAQEACGGDPNELAVRLPVPYEPAQREMDRLASQRIPDLQTGSTGLRDVLVAMEWLRDRQASGC